MLTSRRSREGQIWRPFEAASTSAAPGDRQSGAFICCPSFISLGFFPPTRAFKRDLCAAAAASRLAANQGRDREAANFILNDRK